MVPGADLLADVAAGDPRAKGISDLTWKFSVSIFDGVKSDASAGIDDERFGDGVCRTGIHTSSAATAETSGRFIGFEIQGGEQMANHHPRPPLAVDEVAVFTDPAQTGFLRPGLVQQRCGIHTSFPVAIWTLV